MKAIPAVYYDGAFHPLAPVELPEQTSVKVLLPVGNDVESAAEAQRAEVWARTAGAWADLPGVDGALDAIEDCRREAAYRDAGN